MKRGGVTVSGVDRHGGVVEREYLSECVHGDHFDMMHVCIPFFSAEEGYVDEVKDYMKLYPSKKVLIYSDEVTDEMCTQIGKNVRRALENC